jgi:hypothetical protein
MPHSNAELLRNLAKDLPAAHELNEPSTKALWSILIDMADRIERLEAQANC